MSLSNQFLLRWQGKLSGNELEARLEIKGFEVLILSDIS